MGAGADSVRFDFSAFGRAASRHLCLGLFSKVLVFTGLFWFGVKIGVYV